MKQYPPLTQNEKVVVYENPAQVNVTSEALGSVAVGDGGATSKCDSTTMINLVKEEARKVGGNAVLITEHKRPSIWASSCHQFKATILKMDGVDTLPPPSDHMVPYAVQSQPKERLLPRLTFAADGGIGWRTNPLGDGLTDFERHIYSNLRFGFSWGAYADYFFNDNYGIRLAYQGFRSSYNDFLYLFNEQSGFSGYGDVSANVTGNYVGPAFVMRAATRDQKWLFDLSVGLGYIRYRESLEVVDDSGIMTSNSVGFQSMLGVEYKFAKNFGVGFKLSTMGGTFYKYSANANGVVIHDSFGDTGNGFGTINMLIGLRYHIK